MSDSRSDLRWPNDPPDDRADLERRADRYCKLLGVEDLDALTDQLLTLRKAQRKDGPRPRRDYDIGGKLPRRGLEIAPLDSKDRLAIDWARRPGEALRSWGLVGRYVRVAAPRPFSFARLRFALPKKKLAHLYPGTVVAARWDAYVGRFRVIPASGYSESGEYVYAQTTRTGIFTAIGLPRDPRVLLALRLMATLAPWAKTVAYGGAPVAQPMLDALLKQRLVRGIAKNAALLETFGYRAPDFPAALDARGLFDIADGAIDRVLDKLPEFDLLDALDLPNRMIKPIPDLKLPDEWPMPKGRWESLGPDNVTGRIKALAIHPENGDILYAGAAGGGVWKTIDGGRNWVPTMHEERCLAIGGLALGPSNPDIVYAATGEWTGGIGWPRNPVVKGEGVYRSSDGGAHWQLCAPIASEFCSSVAVDPTNSDIVFVGGDKGLHRSRDGGVTWDIPDGSRHALFELGEISSIAIAHDEPCRLYVGVHKKGVFRSFDGGESWSPVEEGIESTSAPARDSHGEPAIAPKIALGRNGRHGSRFLAVKIASRVYTSTDGGVHFIRCKTDTRRSPNAFYPWCNVIAVDPRDERRIYAGAVDLHRSDDGGEIWERLTSDIHEDQQAVVFDPRNADRVVLGNDGGVWRSTDRGKRWYVISDGLVAGQFYNIAVSKGPKFRVAGAMHDESAHTTTGSREWKSLGLYEGGAVAIDLDDADVVYHGSFINPIHRIALGPGGTRSAFKISISGNSAQSIAVGLGPQREILALARVGRESETVLSNRIVLLSGQDDYQPTVVLNETLGPFRAIAMPPMRAAHCYAIGATHLWRSSNAGKTWLPIKAINLGREQTGSIYVDESSDERLYLTISGNDGEGTSVRYDVVASADGIACASTPILPPSSIAQIAAFSNLEDELLAVCAAGLLCTHDGGRTWHLLNPSPPRGRLSMQTDGHSDRLVVSTMGRGAYGWFA